MSEAEFLVEFGSRAAAYIDEAQIDARPVLLAIGENAHSPAGHLLASALVNQLARAHRRLVIVGDLDRPLLCSEAFGFEDLRGATAGLAQAINPYIEVDTHERAPDGDHLLRIGLGAGGDEPDLRVGCDRWCARFGPDAEIVDEATCVWGAALAACLASAAAFHQMLDRSFELGTSYSLWLAGAESVEQGPWWESPLELGKVLQVGAGAVGAALDYWLLAVGVAGWDWQIIDGDVVDVSNLNRQMTFRASDAGYPGGEPREKARVSAELLGARSEPRNWGEDEALVEAEYDVILALANEEDVRSALQRRQPPILLHATTSANWQAQVHRHIRGRDDCIECRLPTAPSQLRCSTAEIDAEKKIDASLPFLSALAGLLLAAELVRLAEGQLAEDDVNFKVVDLGGDRPAVQALRRRCKKGCRTWLPAAGRRRIAGKTRFASLD